MWSAAARKAHQKQQVSDLFPFYGIRDAGRHDLFIDS